MSQRFALSLLLLVLGVASWGAVVDTTTPPVANDQATAMDGTGFPSSTKP